MPDKVRLLELAINGLKAQAREIESEIDLLERELAETARQLGRGVAGFARGAATAYGRAVVPDAPRRRRRRLSAAQRKAHSERMKKIWAERKKAQKAKATVSRGHK